MYKKKTAPQERGAVEGKKRFSTKEKWKAHKKELRKRRKRCRRKEHREELQAFVNAIIPDRKR